MSFFETHLGEKKNTGFLSIRCELIFGRGSQVTTWRRKVIDSAQVKFLALLAGILNALSGLQPSLLGSCLDFVTVFFGENKVSN